MLPALMSEIIGCSARFSCTNELETLSVAAEVHHLTAVFCLRLCLSSPSLCPSHLQASNGASTPVLKAVRLPLSLVSPSPLKMRPIAGAAIGALPPPPPPPPPVRAPPALPLTAAAGPEASQHSAFSMRVSDGEASPADGGEASGSGGSASSEERQHREGSDWSPGPMRSAVSLTGIERPVLIARSITDRAGEGIAEGSPPGSSSGGGGDSGVRDSGGSSPAPAGMQAASAGLAQRLQGLSHGSREDGSDPKQPSDWGDFVG